MLPYMQALIMNADIKEVFYMPGRKAGAVQTMLSCLVCLYLSLAFSMSVLHFHSFVLCVVADFNCIYKSQSSEIDI